jgi:hypothetical protein
MFWHFPRQIGQWRKTISNIRRKANRRNHNENLGAHLGRKSGQQRIHQKFRLWAASIDEFFRKEHNYPRYPERSFQALYNKRHSSPATLQPETVIRHLQDPDAEPLPVPGDGLPP